jgi:phosphoglycerate dehydrogenase-like enzyme
VLVTLSDRERKLFFPDGFPELPGISVRYLADRELVPSIWSEKEFSHWRPEILVTGWITPPLPLTWVECSDFPVRYISHVTGSVRGLVPRKFLENGGVLTNWGDIIAPYVAEHALLLALATLRNIPAWRTAIKQSEACGVSAVDLVGTRTLYGRRVGLHGFGRIARALVKYLHLFQTEIYAFSEGVPSHVLESSGVIPCDSLRSLFAKSEVLFECEALTGKSERSVNREVLKALPDHAVFVNIGRGLVVDEAALLSEARSGRIRVALDVVAKEPMRTDSDLYQLGTAILSPHIGGPTLDRYPECGARALKNISTYLRGGALEGIVSLEEYDRST